MSRPMSLLLESAWRQFPVLWHGVKHLVPKNLLLKPPKGLLLLTCDVYH